MKFKLTFLLFVGTAFTLSTAESLIQIDNLGEEKYNVPVLEFVDNHFIVLADQSVLSRVSRKRLQYTMLDNDVTEKKYYLVHPFINSPEETIDYSVKILEKYGTVLASYTKLCLMESDDERLHSMTEYRVKLQYLDLKPISFYSNTVLDPQLQETTFNPAIEDMLDLVSPDTVEAYQRKLVSFTTRHCRSTCSKQEFIPWIKQFYLDQGCDTALTITIESGVYEIVGVRYGVEDPSLTNVAITGGHSDVIISGADPDEPHEGANDNTTGQVAVMEACRVHSHYTFDRTIFYTTHNAEEVGFRGSRALATWLSNTGAKTYAGVMTYDMFGMSESRMRFEVYSEQDGAQEFVDKMSALKTEYNLKQPELIRIRTDKPGSSDFVSYINTGYLTMNHNFGFSGAGTIHTADDNMKDGYDPVFQSEVAKLGIAYLAELAGVRATNIQNSTNVFNNLLFKCIQNGSNVVFTFDNTVDLKAGKLEVFNLKGKLIRALKTENNATRVVWDGTTNNGRKVAKSSVMILRYSNPVTTVSFKLIMK